MSIEKGETIMKRSMKFLSFWSINDGVRTEPLCKQMLQMKEHGIEGVVFHPRFYPGDPNYMSPEFIKMVGEVILYARSIGMEFWLYDENGWPSGSADGQVLALHPDSKRLGLVFIDENKLLPDDTVLCRHDGKAVAVRGVKGISPLCRDTTETFLKLTHERYLRELPKEAFDYVTGFFCDEVDYFHGHLFSEGAVPWCADFEAFYTEKYGISPCAELWKLFDTEQEHPAFKVRFWETAGDLIARNFYQPYQAWCEKHGKLFTGHLKGEESPYFQLMFSGSCFTQLKTLSLPAIDALERYPSNHFFPYLLSSVSMQQGRCGCFAEAMGGAGWGVTPNDLERYMLWLAEAGVDRVALHLGQLSLKAQAIRDWPPSVPLHLTWHEAFAEVLSEIRKKAQPLLKSAWESPKVLIVTPTRGVMAFYRPQFAPAVNLHDGSGIPDSESARINADFLKLVEACYESGLRYHLTEERELQNARIENGKLHLGAMTYEKVLIASGCLFEAEERTLIEAMSEMGMLIDLPCKNEVKAEISEKTTVLPEQTEWEIAFPKENQMLLEWTPQANGKLSATVQTNSIRSPIVLSFSDAIETLQTNVNAKAADDDKQEFTLSELGDILQIEITPSVSEPLPFAWLKGDFSVQAPNGWRDFDEKQSSCDGKFMLCGAESAKKLCHGSMIRQGLPFFGGLLTAKKTFFLEEDHICALDFDDLCASAVKICMDGKELGWWWKEHPLAVELSAGEHTISIDAAPSTYNMYGPHHYYLGDCRLTSPLTFSGRKDYMDNADAPEHTLIDTMQFVNFTIDGNLLLQKPFR